MSFNSYGKMNSDEVGIYLQLKTDAIITAVPLLYIAPPPSRHDTQQIPVVRLQELIRQRTIEGLDAARARGHNGGHPVLDAKKVELALKMYDAKTCSVAEITKATGISKSALYTYINARKKRDDGNSKNK